MAQMVDQVMLEWLRSAGARVPRRERQVLLVEELMALHTMQSLCVDAEAAAVQCDWEASCARSVADASAVLRCSLLDTVDTAEARRIAELLAVSTDMEVLFSVLDPRCVMSLHVSGGGPRRPVQQLCGAGAIIDELSEFQESVLLLRVDPSSSRRGIAPSSIVVGGVSPVKTWVQQCDVELEVGTQETYYADTACTHALFDVRSTILFAADGATVERVTRELQPRGGHDLNDVLRGVHFGHYTAE
ncbi:hypothetical protein NESM_000427500 [Novymonas esmeraldas]|uniref:Uncharacterized protein n=1 Tax=Novymonas esmeraldas TaxID=1808958 RepID=A0AAW0ELX3_9TRYP